MIRDPGNYLTFEFFVYFFSVDQLNNFSSTTKSNHLYTLPCISRSWDFLIHWHINSSLRPPKKKKSTFLHLLLTSSSFYVRIMRPCSYTVWPLCKIGFKTLHSFCKLGFIEQYNNDGSTFYFHRCLKSFSSTCTWREQLHLLFCCTWICVCVTLNKNPRSSDIKCEMHCLSVEAANTERNQCSNLSLENKIISTNSQGQDWRMIKYSIIQEFIGF